MIHFTTGDKNAPQQQQQQQQQLKKGVALLQNKFLVVSATGKKTEKLEVV